MASSSSTYTLGMTYSQPLNLTTREMRRHLEGYAGGYYYGGSGGGGTSAPPPATAPLPAAAPASPTASASDLQVMIAAIPTAQDGQVISAEYHNALRAALIAMANRLGLGTINEEITVTNAPRLVAITGTPAWEVDVGIAKKAAAATGALRGWMELDLPDGARIKKMAVFAANDGAGTMRLKLRRQKVTDSTTADLISIDITANDSSRGLEGDVTLPGLSLGAAAIEETRLVNNREYKYLLIAELDAGVATKEATITTVQVVLGK